MKAFKGFGTGASSGGVSSSTAPAGTGGDPLQAFPDPTDADELPWTGTLEKRSALLGSWQPRLFELQKGSLSYYKDGKDKPSGIYLPGDVLSVGSVSPSTLLLQVREPGGEERTLELRASSTQELDTLRRLVHKAFDLGGDAIRAAGAESARPQVGGYKALAMQFTKAVGVASQAAIGAGKKVVEASGHEDWLTDKYRSAVEWRTQMEQQMEDALASCDEGKMEMLLDTALTRGMASDKVPASMRRAAHRVAGRTLREAIVSEDAKRLKGALVAARRLQATDAPEFASAVAKYKSVRQIPEGWDISKMVEERRSGRGRLLAKQDVSRNFALRSLVQLMFDRTLRRVETRDRGGAPMPARLQVVQVSEVQNDSKWVDYLMRREAVRLELDSKPKPNAAFFHVDADTERPLAEAAALAAVERVTAKVKPGVKSGEVMDVTSPVSGEVVRITVPEGYEAGAEMLVQDCLASSLPGPPLETALNETWLFHGCRPIAAESITSDDFRIDLAGTSAGSLYGRGIYLAENSTKADEYSRPHSTTGLCTMLLCRVTLGQLLYSAEVRPDPRRCEQACLGGGCHAVLGDRRKCRGTFREFAVFDEDQIYPNYIVSYRRIMS